MIIARVLAVVMCLSICLSVHLSVFTSHCSIDMAKCRISQTVPHDSQGCKKSRGKLKGVIPNGGAKCRWGRLNAAEVAENWRLSMRSDVNLARLQVYHTFAMLQCIAQGLSATGDPCTLFWSRWRKVKGNQLTRVHMNM